MSVSLPVTKLHIPSLRPELVPRPRLLERLNKDLWQSVQAGDPAQGLFARKLTLISAPAGFGKTTLLSEWLHNVQKATPTLRAAWLSLDEGDDDPARFLAHVVAALQGLEPCLGEGVLGAYRTLQPPPARTLLAALINDIAGLYDPVVLVLDDYHLIEAQPAHDLVVFLLDHLPPQMHLAIATRADPPLPLARMRSRQQMIELRSDHLRFTPDEAAVFLNQVMGLNLADGEIAVLESRTEGWIAGLQLAALSMESWQQAHDARDLSGFVQTFAGDDRYVVDYLVEEVLQGQPEHVQTFLLQTSILSRLSASLCDTVAERTDGWSMLQALEQANLFIIPLDQKRVWYRYHQLFADLLRQRLQRIHPACIPVLHRRASEWYEQYGFQAEAIAHALTAEDYERASQLILKSFWAALARGEMATVIGWLEALPGDLVRSQPRLCLASAWGLLAAMRLEAIEPCLQDAERALQAFPLPDLSPTLSVLSKGLDEGPALLGEIATIRTTVASLRGDVPGIITLAHDALAYLPEEEVFLSGIVTNALGTAYEAAGETVLASQAFATAADLCQRASNTIVALISLCNLGRMQENQGQLHLAESTYRQALHFAARQSADPLPVTGLAHLGLGGLLLEWNDLPAAARHLQEGLRLGRRLGNVEIQAVGSSSLSQLYLAQGNTTAALDAIREAERLLHRYQVSAGSVTRIVACRARLWIAQGELGAAARWVRESGLLADSELAYPREPEQIILAWLLIAQGEPVQAVGLLERLLKVAEAQGRQGRAIDILTLLALAWQAQNKPALALDALARALILAEPAGYIRTFVDKGWPMATLLRRVASSGMAPAYVAKLLAALDAAEAQGTATMLPRLGVPSLAQPLVEPLSERELEVLRWIAAGLSNREIAAQLVITVGTVKWHANNIFGKLQVSRRTEAVARARELGLL